MTDVKETAERISTERLEEMRQKAKSTPYSKVCLQAQDTDAILTELLASRHADAQEGGEVEPVALDGPELWEIVFGVFKGDVPDALTDEVLSEIAAAINATFLYAAPSNPVVSDAMVERAAAELKRLDKIKGVDAYYERIARATLTAALSVNPQSGSPE